MTEQLQSMKLDICQQLTSVTTQLNEQTRDWFQRTREYKQMQEVYNAIERDTTAIIYQMSLNEEYKKELSNAEKRSAKVEEIINKDHADLRKRMNECKLKIELSAHLMECTERIYRMLLAQSRLLGQ